MQVIAIKVFMIGMSPNKGGVETYITNLCQHLDKEKYEIIYCLPEMDIDGRHWTCPKNRHNYFSYKRFWTEFFKVNYFDVIYYNACDIVSIDMLKFAKKAGVKVRVIHAHSTDNQINMKFYHKIFETYNRKYISNYANLLFACSENAGKWMFPNDKFTVIKNGIDIKHFSYNVSKKVELQNEFGFTSKYTIGYLGRLGSEKNPLRTIKIMEAVMDKNIEVDGVIVGDGEYRKDLIDAIEQSKHKNRIHYVGPRNDAYKWYSLFDCLIMPSLFEGLPFTLVEAQTAGLPCVVSSTVSKEADITGTLDFVSLDSDDEIWAEHILDSLKKDRFVNEEKLIKSGFSITDTAENVDGFITEILNN